MTKLDCRPVSSIYTPSTEEIQDCLARGRQLRSEAFCNMFGSLFRYCVTLVQRKQGNHLFHNTAVLHHK